MILYLILCGFLPFRGNNSEEVLNKIKSGVFCVDNQDFNEISHLGQEFIKKLIEIDPNKRLSAQEALEDNWIQFYASNNNPAKTLTTNALKNLKNFRVMYIY